MPKRTLYVRDADLPIWVAAERLYGEKSMSELVTEMLRDKVGSVRDGFLHVLYSNPKPTGGSGPRRIESFAVMFAPLDQNGAMQPHYCYSLESLKQFLKTVGLTPRAIAQMLQELDVQYSSSVRVALPADRIALFG